MAVGADPGTQIGFSDPHFEQLPRAALFDDAAVLRDSKAFGNRRLTEDHLVPSWCRDWEDCRHIRKFEMRVADGAGSASMRARIVTTTVMVEPDSRSEDAQFPLSVF